MASNIAVPVLVLLKVVMVSVLSTWVFLWYLKPTQLWTRKWHQVEDGANKSILGYSGVDFIFFTFPMIFLGMVGLVFTHIQSNESRQGRKGVLQQIGSYLARCNPVAIRTFLGILSAGEVIAIFLFTTLLAWTFYSKISNDFQKLVQPKSIKLSTWQLKLFKVATRCGLLAEINLAFLLFPVLRVLSIFRLVGIQFEASIRYHIWLGTSTLLFATLHGLGTLFTWGTSHHINSQVWKWQKQGRIYVAGEIALLAGLVMWITSIPQIRRRRFEVFYYTHHLYLLFLVFFLFHAGDKHFFMVFSGVFLFGLDKLLRIIHSRMNRRTSVMSARVFPFRTMELTIPKDTRLKYTPTSVIFIKIPTISRFQWHPFSISSSCGIDNEAITVLIKCEGWWSNGLYELLLKELQQHSSSETTIQIPVAIEGPYGPPPASVDFLRYESLIMIAGGIGIAPFLSTLLEITSAQYSRSFPSNIHLVYVVRSSQELSLLSSISHLIMDDESAAGINFKLKIFVTREEQHELNLTELLRDHNFSLHQQSRQLIFGTSASKKGTPHGLHGPEHPLLLAAVAMISCLVFILSLCFLNRVVLQFFSKEEKIVIPSTVDDLILLSCFFMTLAFSATITIISRRRRIQKNDNIDFTDQEQVETRGQARPLGVTGSHHVLENELHFGQRPIFSEVLAESGQELEGGSEVGVVVCGPESMRISVALACRQNRSRAVEKGGDMMQKKTAFCFHSLNFTL